MHKILGLVLVIEKYTNVFITNTAGIGRACTLVIEPEATGFQVSAVFRSYLLGMLMWFMLWKYLSDLRNAGRIESKRTLSQ